MSTPPTPPTDDAPPPPPGDAPLSPAGGTPMQPTPQLQPMQMGGAPAKAGKGKLIGIIAGVLIIVGGLVFAGITYGPGLWAKYMGGGGDLNTPDGTIKYVLNGIANNKPEVLWQVLPSSHQKTLNDELKKSMGNVDPEVHKQSFVVLQKLTGLLKNKKTLILESVNSFAEQSGAGAGDVMPPEVTENWDGVVSLVEIVVNSKFSDPAWVQNPDLGVLLKEDGGKLMSSPDIEKLINFALSEDGDPDGPKDMAQLRNWIKGIEVTVVSSAETTAKVKLSSTDFEIKEGEGELDMMKVEDRWLPQVVALGLDQVIDQLKQAVPMGSLADTGMNARQKVVTMNFLKSVEGVLDAIDNQETAENMMQAAVGGISGLALQLEQLQSAFPNVGGVAGGNPGSFPGGNPGGGTVTPVLPGLPVGPSVPLGKRQPWTMIDPTTGLPIGGTAPIDPTTGLPIGGPGFIPGGIGTLPRGTIPGGIPGGFPGGNPRGNPGGFPGGVGTIPTTGIPTNRYPVMIPGGLVPGAPGVIPGGFPGGIPGVGAPNINPLTGLPTGIPLQPGSGIPGGIPTVTPRLYGLPVGPLGSLGKRPLGKRQRWTINGGKPATRIDKIYLNKPATAIKAVFGVPDSKSGAYWIYKDMTVRNIGRAGTMTKVYFGIQNGVVFDIQARP